MCMRAKEPSNPHPHPHPFLRCFLFDIFLLNVSFFRRSALDYIFDIFLSTFSFSLFLVYRILLSIFVCFFSVFSYSIYFFSSFSVNPETSNNKQLSENVYRSHLKNMKDNNPSASQLLHIFYTIQY